MKCNLTEEDIKNAKYKFGNISIIHKDDIFWLHEENFIMEFNPNDVEEFFNILWDSSKIAGLHVTQNIEYPFDNLMNFLSMKNGYYNTGGLFGYFVKVSELITPTKKTFGSKGTFPFCLIQICRCIIKKDISTADSFYNYYLDSKKEVAKKQKELDEISKKINKDNSIIVLKKWDKVVDDFTMNCLIVEYNKKVYKCQKYADHSERYSVKEI